MNLNIKCFGAKLHYLCMHWGTKSQEGDHLQVQYEAFRMDIGLGGHVFARSWFKHLWHLCHMLKCELSIDFPAFVQQQRESNRALIDVFLDSGLFTSNTMKILN